MQYLILSCDYHGDTPLKPEFENSPLVLSLPPDLKHALRVWNEQMATQIMITTEAKVELARLNAEGQRLADMIADAIPGGAKIKYCKE